MEPEKTYWLKIVDYYDIALSTAIAFVIIFRRYLIALFRFLLLWKESIKLWNDYQSFKLEKENVMGGILGVDAILSIVGFGLNIGYGISSAISDDGKLTPADFPKFMPALIEVPSVISALPKLGAEIMELDEEDLYKVRDFVCEKAAHIPGVKEQWLLIATGAFKMGAGLLDIMAAVKKPADK